MFGERVGQPGRKVAERFARRVLEAERLLHLVAVDRLDERRSGAVGRRRNLPRERRGFERRAAVGQRADDQQPLSGLHVQRDLYGELCVGLQFVVEIHQHILVRACGSRAVRHRHQA